MRLIILFYAVMFVAVATVVGFAQTTFESVPRQPVKRYAIGNGVAYEKSTRSCHTFIEFNERTVYRPAALDICEELGLVN